MGLFSFTQEIAIDLGTANTIIIHNDKIVVDEPSVVALDKRTDKLIAIGEKARQMQGKENEGIRTVRPLRDGVIADFYAAELMPQYRGGALIGQHGSWNRKPHSGYKVIFVPFQNGQPSGKPQDVLTGFLSDKGDAFGRPVGVAVDFSGAILVADDVGDMIWRVSPVGATTYETPINQAP